MVYGWLMRIGNLAERLGTTPDTIRFYERRGFLPGPARADNGYREYTDAHVERLRLLIGLRQLDLSLDQAATLANLCADGQCDQVSDDLRVAIEDKRVELRRRLHELLFLDQRLAHLSGQLGTGAAPRPLITLEKGGT